MEIDQDINHATKVVDLKSNSSISDVQKVFFNK